jgi:general secretion pathway protein J
MRLSQLRLRPCVLYRGDNTATDLRLFRSAGFTLIELIVALILLSLIFLLLASGLQFGTDAWNSRQDAPSDSSEILIAQNLVRRILSEVRPVMIQANSANPRHVFFFGHRNSIRFVASLPKHLGVGGFYEVSIYQTGSPHGRVNMSWRLFRANSAIATQGRDVALIAGVNELQFSYFGSPGRDGSARWYDNWELLDHLPDLIRMRVALSDPDRSWPDLVVAPMVRSMSLVIAPDDAGQ